MMDAAAAAYVALAADGTDVLPVSGRAWQDHCLRRVDGSATAEEALM
jgi:hypothetical protein